MNETIGAGTNNPSRAKEWEKAAVDEENRRRQEQLEGRLRDLEERVKRGSMTAEQAQATKEKMMALERDRLEAAGRAKIEAAAKVELETAAAALNQAPSNKSESPAEDKEFGHFQVASGTSKEAEFKRLTGEDWPGEKYYAVTYGVDEGYDEPIENWTIYERPAVEAQQQPETITNDEVFGHFQVASGTSKEAEFKRLTGEDWPGVEYYATCYGVDEGYDEPIENWTIYKRSSNEQDPTDASEGEDNPEDKDNAEGEKDPNDKDDSKGEGSPEENKNKVDLGDPTVKKLEIAIDKNKTERLEKIEEDLSKMLPDLAELYARNRRIIIGAKNRAEFERVKGEYSELLDEALKLKSEASFNKGMGELSEKLEKRAEELTQQIQAQLIEFVGGDPESTEKTQEEVDAERTRLVEEAEKILRAEYGEMTKELEANVNADFLSGYLEEAAKLEDATINALDNGTACRRFVNKVINNKTLKRALIAAGAVGLAATGIGLVTGLAAGTMSVGLGFTTGGVALGAGKGALMGGLMSRQNSKNSAVRGFASEEEIKAQLESIDSEDANAAPLAKWLLDQYSSAKDQDLASNRKRTALSAGIGAAIGGLMSGVHFNNIESHEITDRVRVGTEPGKLEIDYFDNVDVARGGGMYDSFTQMGGNPEDLQRALDIAHSIDSTYNMVPGSNGVTAGFNGQVGEFAHTYPGPISEWPSVAQSYMKEVADAWARAGLIPSHMAGGGPIYDTVTKTVIKLVPNVFMDTLARATATVGAGAIGGVIGGAGQERPRINVKTPEASPSTPETGFEAPTVDDIYKKLRELEQQGQSTEATSEPEAPTVDDIYKKLRELEQQGQSTEATSEPEASKDNVTTEIIREFGDRISKTGIEIMTSQDGLNEVNSARIAEWWDTLDEDTKNEITQYETTLRGSNYGRALKTWLQINPQGQS